MTSSKRQAQATGPRFCRRAGSRALPITYVFFSVNILFAQRILLMSVPTPPFTDRPRLPANRIPPSVWINHLGAECHGWLVWKFQQFFLEITPLPIPSHTGTVQFLLTQAQVTSLPIPSHTGFSHRLLGITPTSAGGRRGLL